MTKSSSVLSGKHSMYHTINTSIVASYTSSLGESVQQAGVASRTLPDCATVGFQSFRDELMHKSFQHPPASWHSKVMSIAMPHLDP